MHCRCRFTFAIALCSLFFALQPVALRADTLAGAPSDQLGKVNFPTSCSADVQPTIEKGVALLHSFQYKESEQTFADAASRDPKCAMAHWGKAMALYHQLWDFPGDKTLKEGHNDIEQAQKLHSASAREQSFLSAAAAFFQKKSKMSHLDRTRAYSQVLERAYHENPGDVEFGSFYALSLVSLAEEDHANELADRQKAIDILAPLFQQHPDHPGVAHYMIHATDRPELAAQGLDAARRYAAIAPDSSHAIHMPSHIFVRLGLWQDSVNSNIAANASGAHAAEMHMAESHYQTHAMDFLNYSYLQSGREAKAREVIAEEQNVVGATEESKAEHAADLLARTALELHRWSDAAALPIPKVKLLAQELTYRVRVIGKAHVGDVAGARADLDKLKEIWAAQESEDRKLGYPVAKEKHLSSSEVWILFAEGKRDDAVKEMRAVADRQDARGVDSLSMPAREMLADMLLELKRPADALAEYKTSLKNSPNRFDALLGAGRAAQASGDTSGAQSFYAQLTSVCSAGADRPELAEAKTVLAANAH
jgi:tetratricopeptide (TPR) repeat protein